MSWLLDTNVVSEWVKPQPARAVVEWLSQVDEDDVYLSVVALAELRRGIELLDHGRRRQRLEEWLTRDLTERFAGRILAVDHVVADMWGRITARGGRAGRSVGSVDALVAATAEAHELTLATRNVRHFDGLGVALLNPWEPR